MQTVPEIDQRLADRRHDMTFNHYRVLANLRRVRSEVSGHVNASRENRVGRDKPTARQWSEGIGPLVRVREYRHG